MCIRRAFNTESGTSGNPIHRNIQYIWKPEIGIRKTRHPEHRKTGNLEKRNLQHWNTTNNKIPGKWHAQQIGIFYISGNPDIGQPNLKNTGKPEMHNTMTIHTPSTNMDEACTHNTAAKARTTAPASGARSVPPACDPFLWHTEIRACG